ncbi:MAG TPA: hypothetical protein VKP66_10405 [Steroidobacteraceae bacterium]|nr:hypothetical protein [Steroidobacteraceae bacterium]
MTPQSQFTVVAPIGKDREPALRQLLATMNKVPGVADPNNASVPFGEFENLHFARFALLDDPTQGDIEAYGVRRPELPSYLAFLGDCDGPSRECLVEIVRRAGPALREIFRHCADFEADGDLLSWMMAHDLPVAANYVNWVGRTVVQIKEERALQRALAAKVDRSAVTSGAAARQRRSELIAFVREEIAAGRLSLTPPSATPLGWRLAKMTNLAAGVVITLIALPVLLLISPLVLVALRFHEDRDPEICPRPDAALLRELQNLEDLDVSNQYTALGSAKPGAFRGALMTVVLAAIQFSCRHVFTRGFLARVQSIHFARWVSIDDRQRVMFVSNYDGGHQAYMDDFINKAAFGLNVVFSNGVGWPHTEWLITKGSRREHYFKYFQRRHQLPTQVWYKAYPGLTLIDLSRNARIREGLEMANPSDAEVLAWLKLL